MTARRILSLLPGEARGMMRPLRPGVQPVAAGGENKLVFRTSGTGVTLAPG